MSFSPKMGQAGARILQTVTFAAQRALLGVGERNQPDGFAGLDSSGDLLAIPQIRVGTDAEINAITLRLGEIAYCTDTAEYRRGDGTTAGGLFAFGNWRRALTSLSGTVTLTDSVNFADIISLDVKANAVYNVSIQLGCAESSGTGWAFRLGSSSASGFQSPGFSRHALSPFTWHVNGAGSNRLSFPWSYAERTLRYRNLTPAVVGDNTTEFRAYGQGIINTGVASTLSVQGLKGANATTVSAILSLQRIA